MTNPIERRVTPWFDDLNLALRTIAERPDQPSGDVVYLIKDVFTTRNGSWEPSSEPYAVPQWAREPYLDPGVFQKAYEPNNLYGAVIGLDGQFVNGQQILYWTGGLEYLTHLQDTTSATINAWETPGWATMVLYNSSSYAPGAGESGPWCWTPNGLPAEVLCGGGLPDGEHVSTFVVWQAVRAQDLEPTPTPNLHRNPRPNLHRPEPTPEHPNPRRCQRWNAASAPGWMI